MLIELLNKENNLRIVTNWKKENQKLLKSLGKRAIDAMPNYILVSGVIKVATWHGESISDITIGNIEWHDTIDVKSYKLLVGYMKSIKDLKC